MNKPVDQTNQARRARLDQARRATRYAARAMATKALAELVRITVEMCIWLFLAILLSGRFWYGVAFFGFSSLDRLFLEFYFEIVLFVLTLLFPILYSLIFGQLPLTHLRNVAREAVRRGSLSREVAADAPVATPELAPVGASLTGLEAEAPEELLKNLAYSSRKLSESIYRRAGVYLLVGVLIAFSGLVFFYTQTGSLADIQDVRNLILNLAPRFGILFFIELFAFFFLREYRTAMDEFRYFEAIKRAREETLTLIRLTKEQPSGLMAQKLIVQCTFYSSAGKLAPGESTELVETRKLDKNELELLEKVIDALARTGK